MFWKRKKKWIRNPFGYKFNAKELREVQQLLSDDILEKYDEPEYWDFSRVEEYASENNIEKDEGGDD